MKEKPHKVKPGVKSTSKSGKSKKVPQPGKSFGMDRILLYGFFALVILLVLFVRIRLLEFPLERDEGEYALMGQMILKGIPPYEMAYNMKLPGAYYLYAMAMAVFGQTALGVHMGLLLANVSSIILLFFVGKKMGNESLGFYAASTYAFLTLIPNHLGFAAHATQFNTFFNLAGLLVLLIYQKRSSLLYLALSGFLFGCSFIVKQHAIFMMVFGLLMVALMEWQKKPVHILNLVLKMSVTGIAMLVPYALVLFSAWWTGSLDQFWHWTVEYAREYAGIQTVGQISKLLSQSIPMVTDGVGWFWWFGVAGFIALFFSTTVRPYRWWIFCFTILSLACVFPGFYFRRHYYIQFLPALGLLVGIAFIFVKEQLQKRSWNWAYAVPFIFFLVLFSLTISKYTDYLFKGSPAELSKSIYAKENPFVESIEIAKFLEENTTPEDRIAILGSEPQIYFLSHRLPATGYIYAYPLTENQVYSEPMQKDMIAEIEKSGLNTWSWSIHLFPGVIHLP
jgi:4-amino-4-deoxy-L-arabinose transferase-like glycosyltransferase